MKRRALKRRNPMARVVRKLKPKRIPSARDYRRTEKHRKPLRDQSTEAVFCYVRFFWRRCSDELENACKNRPGAKGMARRGFAPGMSAHSTTSRIIAIGNHASIRPLRGHSA